MRMFTYFILHRDWDVKECRNRIKMNTKVNYYNIMICKINEISTFAQIVYI